ncbi:MAG TPA: hypothetical protein VNC82_17545 [Candidatus Limnocylindria bacterium]|nr:hypothetical protein [Candidatus Limnocylindria bacterium]
MSAERLLAPIVVRCAALGGVVLLAALPVYVYVEPPWRILVARLAVAFVLGVVLLQLRRAVAARLARGGASPLEQALTRPGSPPAVPLRFEELIDDVRATRRSRGHFERIMWPRLTALAGRPLAPPRARLGRGPSLAELRRVIADVESGR